MKLLLIEDSWLLIDSLKRHLSKRFVVDVAQTGKEGLRHIESGEHDLVILDLTLPDMGGLAVCRSIRSAKNSVPILILTGVKEYETRVELLNAGADDYVTKPFNIAELEARVRALLRRGSKAHSSGLLQVGDLVLDPSRRQVTRGGKAIELRRKEFDILEYLVRNAGHAVTRPMILSHVWEAGKQGWNNTVDVHIKHLRDKVDRPFGAPLIKTAYGIGYLVEDV